MRAHAASERIGILYGQPMTVLSECLRGFLMAAPGKELISADFSNIEGRVLAWLAGEMWKVEAFRQFDLGNGHDIYVLGYSKSFHVAVELVVDWMRQIGKVQELALGFGGGKGAFQMMAKGYGIKVSDAQAEEIKVAWREAHPRIVLYWARLEAAAMLAIRQPGTIHVAGPADRPVKYKVSGSFLWCLLPSGRALCYPYPKVEMKMKKWGAEKDTITYMAWDSMKKRWERTETYGGSLSENVTQAVARDCLTDAMFRAEDAGFPVVLHVHDEVVCEIDKGSRELKEFEQMMGVIPAWATGLPIAAKGWCGRRYRK